MAGECACPAGEDDECLARDSDRPPVKAGDRCGRDVAAAEAAAIARWSRGRHGVDDQVERPQLARRLCQRGLEPRWVSGIGANRERACLLEWLEVRLRSGDTGDAPTTRKQAARDGTA